MSFLPSYRAETSSYRAAAVRERSNIRKYHESQKRATRLPTPFSPVTL